MRERVCNNCGGKKYKEIGQNMVKCLFCGTIYVDEYANKEEEILIVQAYEEIREFHFQNAVSMFDKILDIYPKSHEAYYGRLQARHKVIYFSSREGTKRYPSFFGDEIPSYFEDDDFKKAIEFAPKEIAESYNEQASRVEKIRKKYLEDAKNFSYDVILNTKSRPENLEKVCEELKERKLSIFLREEIKKARKNIEAFTFQGVKTCKIEVLFLDDMTILTDPKIRNLCQRYIYQIERKQKPVSSFIIAYDDKKIGLDSIKKNFPFLKALFSVNDINFVQDIVTYIKNETEKNFKREVGLEKREIEKVEPIKKEKVEISTVEPIDLGYYNVENVPLSEKNKLKWIFHSIKNGDFATAEKLIEEEKNNGESSGEIYFAALLCERKIKTEDEFFSKLENFKNKEELEKVLKYSSTDFANNFVNRWEQLIVNSKDADEYLSYLEFLAKYQNTMHDEFISEAEQVAIESLNKDLIETVLKCYNPKDVDKYTNFYFQLAQASGDEKYYKKILELDEGHAPSLFALFMKNFKKVEEKLSYQDRKALEDILKFCDTDKRNGFLTDLVNLVLEVSFFDVKKAEKQFDFFLSYINDDRALENNLITIAKDLQSKGFFSLAEKYLVLAIKNDKQNAELYWRLIQIKTHCHSETELFSTSVKISEMEDWKTLLNFASDEQTEKYTEIVSKANISSIKKIFRQELLDKITLKEKLREFLIRNESVLKDAEDKNAVKYYRQQFSAFENYFEKIDNAKTFEEYNDIFMRVFERLEVMDLTIDTSVNLAKIASKKENLEILEKESKTRDEKYLSTIEEERRLRRRRIILFSTLLLAPMLLVFLFLILSISAPKETYMIFSQDGVIVFTILSVIVGLGTLIYNSIKKSGEKKWRVARATITIIGFVNLLCLLFGFYVFPPEINIQNADEFYKIIHNASYIDIKLENDINLEQYEWESVDFYGNLKGENHKIFNIKFKNGEKRVALFDELGGNVDNLILELQESDLKNVEEFASLALSNRGKISNCTTNFNIKIESKNLLFGGLVAKNETGEIEKSTVNAIMSISQGENIRFGGLVGETQSEKTLSQNIVRMSLNLSSNNGDLIVGGIASESGSNISISEVNLDLELSGTVSDALLGGLVGRARKGIDNSYVTGDFNLNNIKNVTFGGLVGELSRRSQKVEYSYQNINLENGVGKLGALAGNFKEGVFENSFAISQLDKLYASEEQNPGLVQDKNCKIFQNLEEYENLFGFSEEIWNLDTLPTLKMGN